MDTPKPSQTREIGEFCLSYDTKIKLKNKYNGKLYTCDKKASEICPVL